MQHYHSTSQKYLFSIEIKLLDYIILVFSALNLCPSNNILPILCLRIHFTIDLQLLK